MPCDRAHECVVFFVAVWHSCRSKAVMEKCLCPWGAWRRMFCCCRGCFDEGFRFPPIKQPRAVRCVQQV